MNRTTSWPEGHWGWPVALTHKHGVRCGQMIFTGGQVDLDSAGTVRNPNDLGRQCAGAMFPRPVFNLCLFFQGGE